MAETDTLAAPQHDDATTLRLTRIGLVLAGLGAFVVVLDPFGLAVLGIVFGLVGAALAFRFGWGESWYYSVAAGAVLALAARIIAGPHQTIGGWLAVLAAVLILVGAPLGYPTNAED